MAHLSHTFYHVHKQNIYFERDAQDGKLALLNMGNCSGLDLLKHRDRAKAGPLKYGRVCRWEAGPPEYGIQLQK